MQPFLAFTAAFVGGVTGALVGNYVLTRRERRQSLFDAIEVDISRDDAIYLLCHMMNLFRISADVHIDGSRVEVRVDHYAEHVRESALDDEEWENVE